MGKKIKRGSKGNAVQFVTRNQALKKLQLKLSGFRRLCILKGIHPREPKKKTQGQSKTYYHVKDLSFLAHDPLLSKFREIYAYERKVRKAKSKDNADLARRLMERRPGYKLDHLVRERYPSFLDAVRDVDDPLTLVHLFATLPAEKRLHIPPKAIHDARRLALEWQAYVVRTHALRKVFVSIKGFYYQAEVLGQKVTWLVPHQLAQVMPQDVDFRVMMTFLDFYTTLLRFVHFKLYHMLGEKYPPVLDSRMDEAAAGLMAIMHRLAEAEDDAAEVEERDQDDLGQSSKPQPMPSRRQRKRDRKRKAAAMDELSEGEAGSDSQSDAVEADDDLEAESDDEPAGLPGPFGRPSTADSGEGDEDADAPAIPAQPVSASAAAQLPPLAAEPAAASSAPTADPAGEPAAAVDDTDEAAVCASVFRGLVFFVAREAPREAMMLVVRAFGGQVGWQGEGSPLAEDDPSITHQVVDRPTQDSQVPGRSYVQPQWVLDSANFRVRADERLYAPGSTPPPHLSPFVSAGEDDYVPDYARTLQQMQAAATAARRRAQGLQVEQSFLQDGSQAGADSKAAAEVDAEQRYQAELAKELQDGAQDLAAEPQPASAAAEDGVVDDVPLPVVTAEQELEGVAAHQKALMPRKHRKVYESYQRSLKANREQVAGLEAKKAQLQKAKGKGKAKGKARAVTA